MKSSEQIDKLLAEQSAEWSERLRHGDEYDRAEFAKWSLKSPQHMRHFLMMVALDQELQRIDPERHLETSSAAAADSSSVVTLHQPTIAAPPTRLHRSRHWAFAACIAGVFALAIAYWAASFGAWHEYSTQRGEQRAVELADGSIMHLNTQSRVKVKLSNQGRDIRLFAGEALFKVARDPRRPFRVHASDIVIQAVGTQFNVYAQPTGTEVAVVEGRVRISSSASLNTSPVMRPETLDAGEQVKIGDKGEIARTRTTDVAAIAAWRQRRLVFNQNPLSEVVTQFNRYNREPQFRIADDFAGLRPYSGAFDADDPESLVELLKIDPDLQLENRGSEILIRRRQ